MMIKNPLLLDDLRPMWLKYAADLIAGEYDDELEEDTTSEEKEDIKESAD